MRRNPAGREGRRVQPDRVGQRDATNNENPSMQGNQSIATDTGVNQMIGEADREQLLSSHDTGLRCGTLRKTSFELRIHPPIKPGRCDSCFRAKPPILAARGQELRCAGFIA